MKSTVIVLSPVADGQDEKEALRAIHNLHGGLHASREVCTIMRRQMTHIIVPAVIKGKNLDSRHTESEQYS